MAQQRGRRGATAAVALYPGPLRLVARGERVHELEDLQVIPRYLSTSGGACGGEISGGWKRQGKAGGGCLQRFLERTTNECASSMPFRRNRRGFDVVPVWLVPCLSEVLAVGLFGTDSVKSRSRPGPVVGPVMPSSCPMTQLSIDPRLGALAWTQLEERRVFAACVSSLLPGDSSITTSSLQSVGERAPLVGSRYHDSIRRRQRRTHTRDSAHQIDLSTSRTV